MKDEIHVITWRDACGNETWRDVRSAEQSKPLLCRVVGWLVSWDDDHITIAASRNDASNHVGDTNTIPNESIVKHVILT